MKHFTWSSHSSAIWEVASKLQEDAIQVDVYLHTAAGEADSAAGHGSSSAPRPTRRKKSQRESISFPAHKLILAAASPFLRRVLSEHYHEHHDACVNITIPHVLPEALQCILNFLYCGSVSVPHGIRKSVVEAANLLQIKDFTDYCPSNVKLEGFLQEHVTSKGMEIEPQIKTTQTPQGRERKRRRFNDEENITSCVSKATVQVKEGGRAGHGSGGGGKAGTGRRRRKIKSKYSTEIYEVNLPKMRKWKRRKSQAFFKTDKEVVVQCPAKTQQSDVSQELHVHSKVPSLSTTVMDNEEKSVANELTHTGDRIKDSLPLPLPPPVLTDSSSFIAKENKSTTTELPLTLTSTSSSVIMPPIFAPEQPYLPDSTTKPEALAEISCPPAIVQEDSMAITESPLDPPIMAVASPPPPPPLLSEVKKLPLISPPSSLASFPLKPVTSLSDHHKISEPLHEDKTEEEEQEDGLFKFQVLLKECEDFPEEVCPVPPSSQGGGVGVSAGKYQAGEGRVDINQWISEEIHSCIIPTTSECEKDSSQCEASTGDTKKEDSKEHVITETNALNSAADKAKSDVECKHCGKTFSDHRSCQSHIRGVHDEARQMCRYCGKLFRRRCDLYQHERRHRTASLPCKYCGKIFKLAKDLQAHMSTHTGGKRFHCNHCNKELTSCRNLRNHIASIHQKERPHTCQECKKTYSKASSLQVHMRSVHTGERPFKCNVCDKAFCNAALLRNHLVVHTGEKKYSCKVCGRPFSQYSNMISHQRIHTNNRPFLCPICQEDFKTKEGLLKHKWVHTGLKPLRCRHCFKEFRVKERYERHMLRCHDEEISLPEIYFEVSDEVVAREEDSGSPYCDIKVIGTTGEEEHFEDSTEDQMLDDGLADGGSADDLGPVVHLVSNIAEQEVTSGEPDHVQLSYPLLTSATGLEEGSSIALGNIAGQISCTGHVEPIDVESLLNVEDTPSGDALMMAGEGKAEVLPTAIHESAVRECEEVVILTKVSEDTDEMSEEMHPPATIKIWIPNERTDLQQQDGGDDSGADILIVSNTTFAETSQAGQVLEPEMSPQAVHTMILEGSDSSL